MAEVPLSWDDLKVFVPDIPEDQANAMIATVWARVINKLAPCLSEATALDDETKAEFVRGILRAVVLRWYDSGSGVTVQRGAGEYNETLDKHRGGTFRPDEISDLQALCATYRAQSASTVPTGGYEPLYVQHAPWCNKALDPDGPLLCDCGAELSANGLPLWTRNTP